MSKIVNKLLLGKEIKRLDILAPHIAQNFRLGQFVMICPREKSKWVPLTIVEADPRRGIISIIFKESGLVTRILGALPIDDDIFAVSGPFGKVAEAKQVGCVVCVADGVSAAQLLPMCRAYSRAENKVICVLGAKTKSELILETQMRIACNNIMLTTEDGSYQRRGTVTEALKETLAKETVKLVYSIGEADMMRDISVMTKSLGIPNLIQVQAVMSCGRGICGSCRVKVGGGLVLSCEDGPEFDGHVIDYDYLKHRMQHVCSHDGEQDIVKKSKGFFDVLLKD